jgi:tRNA(Ile)-lysidine synthase
MLSTVLRTIATHGLFQPGDKVVVAVSGGPDSMALLHVLWELRDRLRLSLEVASIDHGLRADAGREVAAVGERAAALGLAFFPLRVDVATARRVRASLQDAARRVRLDALQALAAERGAARVALGHQADDQAETVLFRIVRGTGVPGLAGIPYSRDPFVRPLLDVRRAEVLRYVRRRSIPFADDPSNADTRFARARIRHRLLPVLAEENPRIVEALVALASEARARTRTAGGWPDADADTDAALVSLSRRAATTVARLKLRGGSAAVDIAGGRRVQVTYGQARIEPRRAARGGGSQHQVVIDGPGSYPWSAGTRLRLVVGEDDGAFDADRVAWPLVMRARRPGDRMRPRGGRGSRKLSDLMIDAKIARAARATLPVLTTADDVVLFVPGLRVAEAGRPVSATRRRLAVSFSFATNL